MQSVRTFCPDYSNLAFDQIPRICGNGICLSYFEGTAGMHVER